MSVQITTRKILRCRFCLLPIIKQESATSSTCKKFVEVFFSTFNIKVSPLENDEVCIKCVRRLRDARNFKELVKKSEERHVALAAAAVVKIEPEEWIEIDDDVHDCSETFDADTKQLSKPKIESVFVQSAPKQTPAKQKTRSIQQLLSRTGVTVKQTGSYQSKILKNNAPIIARNKPAYLTQLIQRLSSSKHPKAGTVNMKIPPNVRLLPSPIKFTNKVSVRIPNGVIKSKASEASKIAVKVTQQITSGKLLRREVSKLLTSITAMPFRYTCSSFRCFFCDKKFPLYDHLDSHVTEHHKDPVKYLQYIPAISDLYHIEITDMKCRKCVQPLPDVLTAVEHLNKEHDLRLNPNCKETIVQVKMLKQQGYNCHLCTQKYHTFRFLSEHMNEHFPNYMCDVCGKPFLSQKRHESHMSTHVKGDIKCPQCDLCFVTQSALSAHKPKHREKRYMCTYCQMKFKSYEERMVHLTEVHNVDHKMVCPYPNCGMEFREFPMFRRHKNKHRVQGRNYPCEVCGMKFRCKSSVRKHSVTHTGEQPFQCKVCNKKFNRKSTLNGHLRIHANDRRYICAECGMSFVQKCSLKGHMKTRHPQVTWVP